MFFVELQLPFVTQMTHQICGRYAGRYDDDLRIGTIMNSRKMRFADGTSPVYGTAVRCPFCEYHMHSGNTRIEKVLLLTYKETT